MPSAQKAAGTPSRWKVKSTSGVSGATVLSPMQSRFPAVCHGVAAPPIAPGSDGEINFHRILGQFEPHHFLQVAKTQLIELKTPQRRVISLNVHAVCTRRPS